MNARRLAVLVLVLAACGDETTPSTTTDTPDTTVAPETTVEADTTVEPVDTYVEPDTAPPPTNTLTFAPGMVGTTGACTSACPQRQDAGDPMTLAVKYATATGQPLAERMISFRFESEIPTELATLSALSTYTDAQGVAKVTVRSYDMAGSFIVKARQSSDPAAGELEFAITLDVPPPPALAVSFEYLGQTGVVDFKLKAFKQENGQPTCASVYPDGQDGDLEPTFTQGPYAVGQQARVKELPGLAQVGQQKWVVQMVAPHDGDPVASGCAEVTADYNVTATALLYLLDLPRHFAGEYSGMTRLDIVGGATGTAGTVLEVITDLFTQPGHLLVTSACRNPPDGVLATICNWAMDGDEPGIFGGIIVSVLDAALLSFLESAIGNDAQDATEYISEMLRDLRLVSIMRLQSEPSSPKQGFDGAYFAPGQATEEWTHVRFRWVLDPNCKHSPNPQDCGWASIPLASIYGSNPTATLSAGIDPNLALTIDMHEVTALKYGPLINAIVERYILPLVVKSGSQPIDSWDKLIGRVFAGSTCGSNAQCCSKFADRIYDDVPDWIYEIAPDACELAIPLLAEGVRLAMSQLSASMNIGTPAGAPCQSHDLDLDRFVDSYGSNTAQCEWNLFFPTGAGDFHPDTDWRAVRQ